MSILRNLLGSFMPHFESRRASGTLAALNAELVLSVDGDESAVIYIDSGAGVLNATYNIQGSPDGTNYYDLLAYPYGTALVGGTLPLPAQALVSETVNVALKRMLCVACGGLQKIRVRLSAWTSGSCAVNINSDAAGTLHPYLMDQKAATLLVSATGVAGAAVTATLPAVTGLRHYIDRVSVVGAVAFEAIFQKFELIFP